MRVDHRMLALMLLGLPLAGMVQSEAAEPVEGEQRVLAESFAQLVFGFCAAIVSGNSNPGLDQMPPDMMLRGPFPLSEAAPLSAPLQARLKAKPEAMIYAATTSAARVGRFQIAYALADGSACVALAQDMPDVVSEISDRIDSDTQYKLQAEDKERRIYAGTAAGGERAIEISLPANLKVSGMEDVQVRRLRKTR